MLELARTGARWLRDYEGWGAGTNTVVVDEGREPLELLRHLEVPGDGEREVSLVRGNVLRYCYATSTSECRLGLPARPV